MRTDSPPTLEAPECEKLLDALLSNDSTAKKKLKAVRNHCMALLMLDAGLRVGELVSLRLADLYFNNAPVRTIFIKPHMTKNKVEHSIPVSQRLSQALSDYLRAWPCLDPDRGDDFAFANTISKRPLTTKQVDRLIRAAGWKAFGRPVHPHMLRHTFASKLMRVTNSSTVQQILGHKFLTSTQVYCHPNEEDKRQAIDSASHSQDDQVPVAQQQQDQSQPVEPRAQRPVPASPLKSQHLPHW
jgi:integrase/recombinase XerC